MNAFKGYTNTLYIILNHQIPKNRECTLFAQDRHMAQQCKTRTNESKNHFEDFSTFVRFSVITNIRTDLCCLCFYFCLFICFVVMVAVFVVRFSVFVFFGRIDEAETKQFRVSFITPHHKYNNLVVTQFILYS